MNSITLTAAEVRTLRETGRVAVRRPVKEPIEFLGSKGDDRNDPRNWGWEDPENPSHFLILARQPDPEWCSYPFECPYGRPGDVLAVREDHWRRDGDGRVCFDDGGVHARFMYLPGRQNVDAKYMREWGWAQSPADTLPDWAVRLRPTLSSVAVARGDGEDRAWEWEMTLEARA